MLKETAEERIPGNISKYHMKTNSAYSAAIRLPPFPRNQCSQPATTHIADNRIPEYQCNKLSVVEYKLMNLSQAIHFFLHQQWGSVYSVDTYSRV